MPRFTNVYTNFAFAKKSSAFIAALPPDVRRRLRLAVNAFDIFRAVPLVRPLALGQSPNRRRSRTFTVKSNGEAEPSPHIRRRSR